jgi:hypothetical protein
MSITQRAINVADLDFDQIKSNLITYFKRSDSPFKDWNFEGSGLNSILDVLAYNTHFNAMLAHMSINETFLDTAQLRSSVVSNAKLLGYIPNSYISPQAIINISFTPKPGSGDALKYITLPKGSQFTSILNNTTYLFSTVESYQLNYDEINNRYTGRIAIYEGVYRTERFQVNSSLTYPKYELSNINIDVSKLIVKVYSNGNTGSYTVFKKFESFDLASAETPLYFIQENTLGKYEISFGDGRFGIKPNNLSTVEVEYFTTNGPVANGCKTFNFINNINDNQLSERVVTSPLVSLYTDEYGKKYSSSGGAVKESLDSIRFNAPLTYVSQNRAVTVNDYITIIKNEFPRAEAISVWGGEDHIPVSYGKVFISVKPKDGNYISDEDRDYLYSVLRPRSILTIQPVIIDPNYIKLSVDVLVKYNKNVTALSRAELEEKIRNYVIQYSDSKLESFENIFTYSNLLSNVLSVDSSITNGHLRIYLTQKFTNNPNIKKAHTLDFGGPLDIDDDRTIVYSSSFLVNGKSTYIGDAADPTDSNKRVLYTYYVSKRDGKKIKVNKDIGYINLSNGIAVINTFTTQSTADITLEVISLSNDVVPERNQIIQIDTNRLNVIAEVDVVATGGPTYFSSYAPFKRER